MFRNRLQKYSATICDINMQPFSDEGNSKLMKELQCYNL